MNARERKRVWVGAALAAAAWVVGAAAASAAAPGAEERELPYGRAAAGDSLRLLGELDRAEAEYQAALKLAKGFQAGTTPREEGLCLAHYGLARIAVLRHQPEAAEKHLDECKDKPKFEGQYLLGKGLNRLEQKKLDEAETFLMQGASRLDQSGQGRGDPVRREIAVALVDVSEAKEIPDLAVSRVDELIALAPGDPTLFLRKGRLLLGMKKWDEAVSAFRQAVVADSAGPRAVEAYREIATVYTRAKQPAKAAQHLERLAVLQPTAANNLALGAAWDAAGQPAKSAPAYRRATELDPASTEARLGLARSAFLAGDRDLALASYQAIADSSALGVHDHESVGRILLDRKDYAAARAAYLKAAAADSAQGDATFYVGYTYYLEGKYAEAIPYFEKRVAADSTAAGTFANLGLSYWHTEQVDRAVPALERAVALDPKDTQTRVWLAQALAAQGAWARAVAAYQGAIDSEPENAVAWNGLGYCHLKQERYNDAVRALVKADSLEPRNEQTLGLLGQTYGMSGQLDQAAAVFRRVLQVNPNSSEARAALAEIEKVQKANKKRAKSSASKRGGN